MKRTAAILAAVALAYAAPCAPAAQAALEVSAPLTFENLTVYLARGASLADFSAMPLSDAMAVGAAHVYETDEVNQIEIENNGDSAVFVSAGDIVKGGRQDRAIAVSLVVPPNSGRFPVEVYCVEQGRWQQRGDEPLDRFSAALEMAPLKSTRLALKGLIAHRAGDEYAAVADALKKAGDNVVEPAQNAVWLSVEETSRKLTASVASPVAHADSPTSLQLTLENEALRQAQAPFIEALEPAGLEGDDVIGAVFVVNGKVISADLFASAELFRAMWPKLIRAAAIEAISTRTDDPGAPPSRQVVSAFLAAEGGRDETVRELRFGLSLVERRTNAVVFTEIRSAEGDALHRNYLAR